MKLRSYVLPLILLTLWSACGTVAASEDVRVLAMQGMAPALEDLEQQYPQLDIVPAADASTALTLIGDCDAVIGYVDEEMLHRAKKLRWVQVLSAGVEGVAPIPALRDSEITLTNAKIIQGPEIADHAMALLLSLTRNLKHYDRQMADAKWSNEGGMPLLELRGKTMLIVGLGGIGTQVAERAAAFGMRVIGVDTKDIPLMRAVDYAGKPDELDALLPEADVVVSCVPRTPQTEGMLGAEQFERMKAGVYVINVSRGAIINTDALVAALESGKVAAAGLDVTEPEPLPADSPLWHMPNVLITPHVAGGSDGIDQRRLELIRDNIGRFVAGKPMRNIVNKEAGY